MRKLKRYIYYIHIYIYLYKQILKSTFIKKYTRRKRTKMYFLKFIL
jgi:hypothetical protein